MQNEQNINNAETQAVDYTACYVQPSFSLYQGDCINLIKSIPSDSINCILTDPPYLYLKGQKLEREFDEKLFFAECKRVLKNDGFITLFGRGTSFYRWNSILSDLGFVFKEEIIWDKSHCTSPLMSISRVHETISISTKKSGKINKVKIPYLEIKKNDIQSIIYNDINRLRTTFRNAKSLQNVLDFLENNNKRTDFATNDVMANKSHLRNGKCNEGDRAVTVMNSIENGLNEKTIIRTDRYDSDAFVKFGVISDKRKKGDKCVDVIQSIEYGLTEKTIIKQIRDHYNAIHPTQKPVRLLERLIALTTNEEDLILDPFSGSCSTGIACINANRKFIGYEIDGEYFDKSVERIKALHPRLF